MTHKETAVLLEALHQRRFSDTSLASALCRHDVRVSSWVRANWSRCAVARGIAENAVSAALSRARFS